MAIKACTLSKDYKSGIRIQQRLSSDKLNNSYIQASLLLFYFACQDVDNAMCLFSSSTNKSPYMYTIMFKGLISNNMAKKVFDILEDMKLQPNEFHFTVLFSACGEVADNRTMKIGKKLLAEMPEKYRQNTIILNSAIDMLMKFGDVETAEGIFQTMKLKDIITYGAMMKGYNTNNMPEKALDLFEKIDLRLMNATYTIVFNACAQLCDDRAKRIGRKLLDEMPINYQNNIIILNSAIDMLMKFGDVETAERIFRLMKLKDIITYGAMMKGYNVNETYEKTLDLFEQINVKLTSVVYTIVFNACAQLCNDRAKRIGRKLLDEMPINYQNNTIIMNAAIDMSMRFGDVETAERIFRMMKSKDINTYGALLNGYNMNDQSWSCFGIFEEMNRNNINPNNIIWTILIGACSNMSMLHRCQLIVDKIPFDIQNNIEIQNSLIDMWGKCGSPEKALNTFNSVVNRNTITYNTMINAFGLNGMGYQAIKLYRQMPDHLRDCITHISVLNACSHAGLLQEARTIFNEVPVKTTSIIITMIDCLSRLFMFDEAEKLIDDYEKTNPPSIVMYMCLLSGARNNRNTNISEKTYKRMKCLFPNEKEGLASGAILHSNVLSSVGEYEQAKHFRSHQMKELGVKVQTGLSWSEIKGQLVALKAHDHSHPQSKEIYAKIDQLKSKAIEHGFTFDSSWITRELSENETNESALCSHSEILVIALNLIQEPAPKLIQLAKNLRVCGHCHKFTKYIAKIENCDIIVRDANRIHHFYSNGQCSCQDHF